MRPQPRNIEIESKLFRSLCLTLSGRVDQAAWSSFTAADWASWLHMACAQGVAPLIYRDLKDQGWPPGMPEDAQTTLQGVYYQTALKNMRLYGELEHVLKALGQAEIPVIVLKGAALAKTLYPDMALRPMGDVDLLVPEERLPQAGEIAAELGYVEAIPDVRPGLKQLLSHHLCLMKADKPHICLELHKNVIASDAYWYAAPVNWLWQQAAPVGQERIMGGDTAWREHQHVFLLTPAAHLLLLVTHAMLQHGEGRMGLLWFYDIHRLVNTQGQRLDWDALRAQAEKNGWMPALTAALARVERNFSTPIPDGVRQWLGAGSESRLRRLVSYKAKPTTTRMFSALGELSSLKRTAWLRLVAAHVFPSMAYMRWRYNPEPAWLWPFYYLYRWFDVTRDILRSIARRRERA